MKILRIKRFFLILISILFLKIIILILKNNDSLPTKYNQNSIGNRNDIMKKVIKKINQTPSNFSRVTNACILVLLKNDDLNIFIKTLTNFEKNFNSKYNYPYVLFNDQNFTINFKKKIKMHTESRIEFSTLSVKEWSIPKWIDRRKLNESLKTSGHSIGYSNMCRFFSGFFFRHKSMFKYEIYWRIDSNSDFPCPINEDPFQLFKNNQNLIYGFALAKLEASYTIPTLWKTIKKWVKKNKIIVQSQNESALSYVSNNNGHSLTSLCTFYNNFEIAKLSMYRNQNYLSYFQHLDQEKGFFHERWGDAPVHTYYATLMLKKSQIHLFENIPYGHQITRNHDEKCRIENKNDQCILNWKNIKKNF